VLGTFKEACKATETADGTLRLRLYVDRSVPELHNLYWETLRDPRAETWPASAPWLVSNQRVLLSRYGRSRDWRPVRLRPATAALANSSSTHRRGQPGSVAGGSPRWMCRANSSAREALQPITPDEIASDRKIGPCDPECLARRGGPR
jgi:hypothetical protein